MASPTFPSSSSSAPSSIQQQFVQNGFVVIPTATPGKLHDYIYNRMQTDLFEYAGGNKKLQQYRKVLKDELGDEFKTVWNDVRFTNALKEILGDYYYANTEEGVSGFPHYKFSTIIGQAYHKDNYNHWPRTHFPDGVICMYYPQDVDEEMGPTKLLPGSQYLQLDREKDFRGEDYIGPQWLLQTNKAFWDASKTKETRQKVDKEYEDSFISEIHKLYNNRKKNNKNTNNYIKPFKATVRKGTIVIMQQHLYHRASASKDINLRKRFGFKRLYHRVLHYYNNNNNNKLLLSNHSKKNVFFKKNNKKKTSMQRQLPSSFLHRCMFNYMKHNGYHSFTNNNKMYNGVSDVDIMKALNVFNNYESSSSSSLNDNNKMIVISEEELTNAAYVLGYASSSSKEIYEIIENYFLHSALESLQRACMRSITVMSNVNATNIVINGLKNNSNDNIRAYSVFASCYSILNPTISFLNILKHHAFEDTCYRVQSLAIYAMGFLYQKINNDEKNNMKKKRMLILNTLNMAFQHNNSNNKKRKKEKTNTLDDDEKIYLNNVIQHLGLHETELNDKKKINEKMSLWFSRLGSYKALPIANGGKFAFSSKLYDAFFIYQKKVLWKNRIKYASNETLIRCYLDFMRRYIVVDDDDDLGIYEEEKLLLEKMIQSYSNRHNMDELNRIVGIMKENIVAGKSKM